MFKFITTKPLWANVLFAFAAIAVLVLLFMLSLNLITRHGNTLVIPQVTGKLYDDAKKILEGQGFEVQVQDSIYNDTAAPLAVLRQFPDADELVKSNRTVYLTINRAVPPMVEMPMLEGLSYRNAEMVTKQYGLKIKDTSYKTDFARNAVLEQLYNGDRIKPGTKINMGSGISLVLGSGLGMNDFPVPDLIGRTYAEARILVESNALTLGDAIPDADVQDSANAFVYWQSPERMTADGRINRIRPGQLVYLRIGVQRPVRATADSTNTKNATDY